ncbi:MAG TPA: hypothetical protein VMI06_00060 [Terriglobia bacterium]|nr:hypothetical protein [Terriglobia bacterium]
MNRINCEKQISERIRLWTGWIKERVRQVHDWNGNPLRRKLLAPWMRRQNWRISQSRPARQSHNEEKVSRKSLLVFGMLALLSVMSVSPAHAQDQMLTAYIPFAFEAGTSTLPAGVYTLERLGESQHSWVIRNDWDNAAVFALPGAEGTSLAGDSSELLFHRYGDRYFLSQIRCLGETYEMPSSKAERSMKREMVRNNSKPESLSVLASLR